MFRIHALRFAAPVLAIVLVALGASTALAQDPIKVGGDVYKLKFENGSVRAMEVTFKPGAKIAMHSHPDHLVYILTAGKLKITTKEGKVTDLDAKVGDTIFISAETHEAVNTGTTELKALVIEIKPHAHEHETHAAPKAEAPAAPKAH